MEKFIPELGEIAATNPAATVAAASIYKGIEGINNIQALWNHFFKNSNTPVEKAISYYNKSTGLPVYTDPANNAPQPPKKFGFGNEDKLNTPVYDLGEDGPPATQIPNALEPGLRRRIPQPPPPEPEVPATIEEKQPLIPPENPRNVNRRRGLNKPLSKIMQALILAGVPASVASLYLETGDITLLKDHLPAPSNPTVPPEKTPPDETPPDETPAAPPAPSETDRPLDELYLPEIDVYDEPPTETLNEAIADQYNWLQIRPTEGLEQQFSNNPLYLNVIANNTLKYVNNTRPLYKSDVVNTDIYEESVFQKKFYEDVNLRVQFMNAVP
jgi:hypothetical protein